ESRVLCCQLSPADEFPTARSLRQAGFNCTTVSEQEIKYTKQRVRWIFDWLAEDPPDVFVANAVSPAAYYAGRWLREAGIPTVGICHGRLLDEFVLARTAYQVSARARRRNALSAAWTPAVLGRERRSQHRPSYAARRVSEPEGRTCCRTARLSGRTT